MDYCSSVPSEISNYTYVLDNTILIMIQSPRRTRSGRLISRDESGDRMVDANSEPPMVVVKQEVFEELEEKFCPPAQVRKIC